MTQIAVWSPLPGGSGSTALAAALPAVLAMEYRTRVLMVHGGRAGERMEQGLPIIQERMDHSMISFEDHGVDALVRVADCGRLNHETLRDYTLPLLSDRLDLLSGRKRTNPDLKQPGDPFLTCLLETAKRGYDVIVADAGNGYGGAADQTLLHSADLVFIGLTQNLRALELFFEQNGLPDVLQGKDWMAVIGRYDSSSHCSIQNIKRRFGIKKKVFGIPYSPFFMDAWNSRSVILGMQRARGGFNYRKAAPFYCAVKEAADAAAEQLGLPAAALRVRGD